MPEGKSAVDADRVGGGCGGGGVLCGFETCHARMQMSMYTHTHTHREPVQQHVQVFMMAFITGHHHHYSGKCCSNFNERSNDNYSFSRMAQKDIKEKREKLKFHFLQKAKRSSSCAMYNSKRIYQNVWMAVCVYMHGSFETGIALMMFCV